MTTRYFIWAGLAGAFIPVMAILNARLGKAIGSGLHAPVIAFTVSIVLACVISLALTKSLPNLNKLTNVKPFEYLGGFIVAFYVISATLLAPKIGVANFIVCAVSSQIITSVLIDNYGLFGATVREVSTTRIVGVLLLLIGLVITQLADTKVVEQS